MLRSTLTAFVLTLACVAGHTPALAQSVTIDDHFRRCLGITTNDPDEQILSCTWLLDNGGLDAGMRASAHLSRAIAHTAKREIDRAHADFDLALDLHPVSIGAYGLQAALFMEHGRFRDALAIASTWVSVRASAIAYERRGINRFLTGDVAGGENDYRTSLSHAKTAADKAWISMRVCGYLAKTLAAMGRNHVEAPDRVCADMLARSETLPSEERALLQDTLVLALFVRNGEDKDDAEVLALLEESRSRHSEMATPTARVLEFERMIRQRALQLLGIWPGDADGADRPETRQAVAELQRRSNLAPTGTFDIATVNALKIRIADRFPE